MKKVMCHFNLNLSLCFKNYIVIILFFIILFSVSDVTSNKIKTRRRHSNSPDHLLKDYAEELDDYDNGGGDIVSWTGVRFSNKKKNHSQHVKQTKSGLIIEENTSTISSPSSLLSSTSSSSSSSSNKKKNQRRRGRGQRQRMHKNALRLLNGQTETIDGGGAFPPLFNIAPRASITVNATCGQNGREEYCKLVDAYPHKTWATQCGICNMQSSDSSKHHPIDAVLGNSNLEGWWQSSTLEYGRQFEYVTITIDLKQNYQVFFIMLKTANTPRPASWILEKSFDGINYEPWQYFGVSDADCRQRYGLPGQNGKYPFKSDQEVICTTQFSKPLPLEHGEIHMSMLKNRPGAMEQKQELLEFITTRFIRIRLQGMHSTADSENRVDWLLDSQSLEKRSFYSLKQIRISGRLDCHGHANKTFEVLSLDQSTSLQCDCMHNTCGDNCAECCPMYQNRPFRIGMNRDENACEKCDCNGHGQSCVYDRYLEIGICEECANFTTGTSCEFCQKGYYRPRGSSPSDGCIKCNCSSSGTTADCIPESGECLCKEGFEGENCEYCSTGYYGELCTKCACDSRGTLQGAECEDHCMCKLYVEGENCSQCTLGYFGLSEDNPEGCMKCYCSGVGLACKTADIEMISYETLSEWMVTDISNSIFAYPSMDNDTGNMVFGMFDLPDVEAVYWLAPKGYVGNRLSSYGSRISLLMEWVVIRGDTSGKPTRGPSIILIGKNGMKIAYGDQEFESSSAVIDVELKEGDWYHVPRGVRDIVTRLRRTEYHGDPVSRFQFMSVLADIESILIRGTFHTDQVESILERATIYSGSTELNNSDTSLVEDCTCPPGYQGMSCENCEFGYIRIFENSSDHQVIAKCVQCPCNGHTDFCDLETGKCGQCQHNTFGERCERCNVGFYGNPMHGTENDCQQCGCPLLIESNNFSPSCQLKKLNLDINLFGIEEENSEYICTQCSAGYVGDHCEMCDDGFFGNPTEIGSKCLPCPCNGGPCDVFTGACITCNGNTDGWHCERCKFSYWGDPAVGCEPCECYGSGSDGGLCDSVDGQCLCKPRFTGQKCDKCDVGYTDIDLGCLPCECHVNGSVDLVCDPFNGQCSCLIGVVGLKCNQCLDEYFGLEDGGCQGKYF